MYGSLQGLIEKLSKSAKIRKERISFMIDEKQRELSSLITKEGAAHLVASELGIDLLKSRNPRLKIENITEGQHSVSLKAKVSHIGNIKKFERNGQEGKVCSLWLKDETGSIKLILWNEQTDLLEKVNKGCILLINGGWVKRSGRSGKLELRFGKESKLEITSKSFRRLSDAKPGLKGKARATLSSIRKEGFFRQCPICKKRVIEKCKKHPKAEPVKKNFLTGIAEDGERRIHCVSFGALSADDLGKDLLIEGRIRKNKFLERPELLVEKTEEIDPEKEAKKLLKSFKI